MSRKAGKATASVISLASARDEPNYYEILQLEPDASHVEIVNAYRRAKETYKQNSLAAYSLFDEEEKKKAMVQIDEAYRALSLPGERRRYDQAHVGDWPEKKAAGTDKSAKGIKKSARSPSRKQIREFERLVTETRVFTGAALKAIREHRRISINDIADRTKICKTFLLAIENEEASLLPSGAYLRSFLRQYAAQLGLDPQKAVDSYPPLQNVG